MAFTPEQSAKVVEALHGKLAGECLICRNKDWLVLDGLGLISLPDNPNVSFGPGRNLPCIPVVCKSCGNIIFFNPFVLGLGSVLGLQPGN
jgi:hypothetical protein